MVICYYFSDILSLIHGVFGLYVNVKVMDNEVVSVKNLSFPESWVHGWPNLVPYH